MISHTTAQFRRLFAELPTEVQRQARRAYRIFRQNPNHPSLRFKPVHPTRTIYSVRINPGYRAVGILEAMKSCGTGSARTGTMITFFHNGNGGPNYLLETDRESTHRLGRNVRLAGQGGAD